MTHYDEQYNHCDEMMKLYGRLKIENEKTERVWRFCKPLYIVLAIINLVCIVGCVCQIVYELVTGVY